MGIPVLERAQSTELLQLEEFPPTAHPQGKLSQSNMPPSTGSTRERVNESVRLFFCVALWDGIIKNESTEWVDRWMWG
jgi:hypothetical protein